MNEVRTTAADFGIERIALHPCGFVLILSIETNVHTFAQRQQLLPNETIDCIAHTSLPPSYTEPCQHNSKHVTNTFANERMIQTAVSNAHNHYCLLNFVRTKTFSCEFIVDWLKSVRTFGQEGNLILVVTRKKYWKIYSLEIAYRVFNVDFSQRPRSIGINLKQFKYCARNTLQNANPP